ncbi:exosome complex component CSL4-like isoform X2 [Arapaima gigas]
MSPVRLCDPGERLCSAEHSIPGTGTYLKHGCIFASLAGYVLQKNEEQEGLDLTGRCPVQLLPYHGRE